MVLGLVAFASSTHSLAGSATRQFVSTSTQRKATSLGSGGVSRSKVVAETATPVPYPTAAPPSTGPPKPIHLLPESNSATLPDILAPIPATSCGTARNILNQGSFENSTGAWSVDAGYYSGTLSYVNDGTAHDGVKYGQLSATSTAPVGVTESEGYSSIAVGDSYTFSVWVRAHDGSNYQGSIAVWALTGTTKYEFASQNFLIGGGWTLVSTTLNITGSGHNGFKVDVFTNQASGEKLDIDGGQLQNAGLPNASFDSGTTSSWTLGANSGGTYADAVYGSGHASGPPVDGADYLEFHANSAPAYVYQSVTLSPTATVGWTYTFSAWVRSPDGSSLPGSLNIQFSGGTAESDSTSFTVAGANWQLVEVSAPVTHASHSSLIAQLFTNNTTGRNLDVDGAQLQNACLGNAGFELSSTAYWSTSNASYSDVTGSNTPFDGSRYGKVTSSASSGYIDQSQSISTVAGESFVFSAWVKSDSGSSLAGSLVFTTSGGTAETYTTTFSANSTWQFVSVPMNTSSSHTGLDPRIVISPSGGVLDVDGTSLANANQGGLLPPSLPPPTLTATQGNDSAALSWTAPSAGVGGALSGYTITPVLGGVNQTPINAGNVTSYTVTGLTLGGSYTFLVAATNAGGAGPPATSNSITAAAPPGAPTSVNAQAVVSTDSDGRAEVTWTAPVSNYSAITSYTVTPYVGSSACTTPCGPVTVTGTIKSGAVVTSTGVKNLTKGTTYTFQVTATNAIGTGSAGVSNAVTPLAPPAYRLAGAGTTGSPVVTAGPTGYASGTLASTVAVGDITGNGSPDIVTGDGSSATKISALLNTTSSVGATGHFAQPATTTDAGTGNDTPTVYLAPLRNNGRNDVVVLNGNNVGIMLSNTDGTFGSITNYALPNSKVGIVAAFGDMNGDGHLDIVVGAEAAGIGSTVVDTLLGNGDGTFQSGSSIKSFALGDSAYATPQGITVADLYGSGTPEVAYLDGNEGGSCGCTSIIVLQNDGSATLTDPFGSTSGQANPTTDGGPTHPATICGLTGPVLAADIDGDHRLDLATLNQGCYSGGSPGIEVLLSNGDGSFQSAVEVLDPNDSGGSGVQSLYGLGIQDMNGDGTPDIVTADYGGGLNGASVYLNPGAGQMDSPVYIPAASGFHPTGGLGLTDLNGDGKPDIVLGDASVSAGATNVDVLLNGTDFPPLGGALGPNEMHGCLMCQAEAGGGALNISGNHPITVNTGEMSHTFTDVSIPARGYPIEVTQTYNSLNAGSSATDYGLGYGWWSPLFMNVNTTTGTVTQEDGAQALFYSPSSGVWAAVAPRTQATLTYTSGGGDDTWTFTRYGGDSFDFNASGQITKIVDLTGDSLTVGYTSGKVTSLTHADGRSLAIAWSGSDISSITDANVSGQSRVVSFTYGTSAHANELTQIDWKLGGTNDRNEQFTYDETTWAHGMLSMQDPDGHVVSQTYNSDGTTATQTIDPSGLNRQTTYTYLPARTSTYAPITAALITDPVGNQEVDEFAWGTMVQQVQGLTGCSTSSWSNGFPTGCTTTNAATTTHAFDPTSLGTTLTVDPNGNTSQATYDSLGNQLSATDALGRTTTWTYSGADKTHYQPTTMTDANGVTTSYSYDTTYRTLTRVCTPLPTGACGSTPTMPASVVSYAHGNSSHPGDVTSMTDADSNTWTYAIDSVGDAVGTKDPLGNFTASEDNADGWQTASWTARAGCTFSATPTVGTAPAGCSSTYETTYSYLNGSYPVFWPDVTTVNAPLSRSATSSYDNDNNVTEAVDFNGNATSYTYDQAGELCATLPNSTSPASCTTFSTNARITDYTADGQVRDVRDGLNNTIETFNYDSLNRPCWTYMGSTSATTCASPPSGKTAYAYDADGNVVTKTGANTSNNVTQYAYDAANELCGYIFRNSTAPTCSSPPSGEVSMTYDSDGQRTGMSDATGNWSYTIDALHRLTSVTEAQGGSSSATVGYQYNYRNEPTQITYPGSHNETVTYDNAGRLSTTKDWLSSSNTTTFGYDADSNWTSTTFQGGSCTSTITLCDSYTYDAADELTQINDEKSSSGDIFAATYTRDNNGQLASDTSAPTSPNNQSNYKYTPLNQVCVAGSSTSTCSSGGTGSEPFAYDNGDNLTTFGGSTQTFNSQDQLCWTASSSGSCASPPGGATTYTFDAQGNRTVTTPSSGPNTCTSFDTANRLTGYAVGTGSSCTSPTTSASYLYNGDGLRMSKTVGSTTTTAAWDLSGSLPLQIADGNTDYLYGPGGTPLEQINGSAALWFHPDQIGSTRAITDGSGNVQATYQFDPYGELLSSTNPGSVTNPFRFQGEYQDGESGLYYLRARYYDPATAQFMSVDPAVSQTRSPYAYVACNPLNATDGSRLDAWYNDPQMPTVPVPIAVNSPPDNSIEWPPQQPNGPAWPLIGVGGNGLTCGVGEGTNGGIALGMGPGNEPGWGCLGPLYIRLSSVTLDPDTGQFSAYGWGGVDVGCPYNVASPGVSGHLTPSGVAALKAETSAWSAFKAQDQAAADANDKQAAAINSFVSNAQSVLSEAGGLGDIYDTGKG